MAVDIFAPIGFIIAYIQVVKFYISIGEFCSKFPPLSHFLIACEILYEFSIFALKHLGNPPPIFFAKILNIANTFLLVSAQIHTLKMGRLQYILSYQNFGKTQSFVNICCTPHPPFFCKNTKFCKYVLLQVYVHLTNFANGPNLVNIYRLPQNFTNFLRGPVVIFLAF